MNTTRLALGAAVCAVLVAAMPATATAQDANPQVKSRSEGFFVGVAYEGNGVVFEDADATDTGPGVGVTVGYAFHPNFSAYAQFSSASVDGGLDENYGFAHFDVGTRVHFRAPAKTVVPYLQAGLSSRAFQQDVDTDEIKGSGVGFAFGGGINAHFNPALAFTAGVVWSIGNAGDFKVNGSKLDLDSVGMTTARVQVGIVWFPQQK